MKELKEIRMKVELGRKKMAFLKQQEASEQQQKKNKHIDSIVSVIDKQKKERNEELIKDNTVQERLGKLRTASKIIFSAAAAAAVVIISIQVVHSVKESKNRYEKYKAVLKPVSNSESLEACDFARKFISDFSSRGETGVSAMWSKLIDSETKTELEVALRHLDPTSVNFSSVDRLPGMIVKVNGTHKGSPVVFLLDSSSKEFLVRHVEVHM